MKSKKPFIPLSKKTIKSHLTYPIEIHISQEIDSTNNFLLKQKNQNTALCVAEQQLAGRGRQGKTWHSPFGQNIYLSLSHRTNHTPKSIVGFSLVIALAACKALEKSIQLPKNTLLVKWPNDIYANNKKIAGILIETKPIPSKKQLQLVIGIGINTNMPIENNSAWESLKNLTNTSYDRNLIIAELANTLMDYAETFFANGLASYSTEWQQRDYLTKQNIRFTHNQNTITGKYLGITDSGEIRIQDADGHILTAHSGMVSTIRIKDIHAD